MADRRTTGSGDLPAPLRIPQPGRPRIPEYGVPDDREGLLDWPWVVERMTSATTYWISTLRPDGRPHMMPTWGAWLLDRLWLEGGLRTRRARNLAHQPACTVSTQRADDVVIVEGRAVRVGEPGPALQEALLEGYAKYSASHGYVADPENWRSGGLWFVEPRVVFAWSSFPVDCTRWTFEES
jgi:hypothetical protein